MNGITLADLAPGTLAHKAVDVMEITARLVKRAKLPDFSMREWDELAALVDTRNFERVAANRESRGWDEDIALRHQFALLCDFAYEVRRVAEAGDRVYVDVIETMIAPDETFSVNTLGVVEFDADGKIRRSTTYQQWDPGRVPTHVGRHD